MLEKCVLTVLELNWNKRLGHKKTKLNICHHMLTSSTQLQNRSFHVVERTRTSSKCQKLKNARAKRAKILFFIVKYANLWGFCCRRGCLSSLVFETTARKHWKFPSRTFPITADGTEYTDFAEIFRLDQIHLSKTASLTLKNNNNNNSNSNNINNNNNKNNNNNNIIIIILYFVFFYFFLIFFLFFVYFFFHFFIYFIV